MHATTHPRDEQSLFGLITGLREDVRTLFHEEVQLAKKEVSEKLSKLSRNGIFLAAGAAIGFLGLVFLLLALSFLAAFGFEALGLTTGMALFLGFLSTAVVSGALGGILLSKGMSGLSAKSLVPEKTIETLQEIKAGGLEQVQVPIKRVSDSQKPEDNRNSDQIRADLERTRGRIGREVRGLKTRLSLGTIALRAVDRVAMNPARSMKIGLGTGLAGFVIMRAARMLGRRRAV